MPEAAGIKRYGKTELRALMESWGEPTFRTTQLLRWLYARGVHDYQEMTDLPGALRSKLESLEPLAVPEQLERHVSADKARKYLLRLADGVSVEAVGIPMGKRLTVCFSTQAGCAMGCAFCATGTGGLTRSLHPGEMVDQLVVVARDFGTRVTNAVAMGEGEPLANYEATLAALRIINAPDGLGIGARHITVSSCGLLQPLRRFATEPEQFTLALSLHSAVQTTRDALMPALAHQPLDELRQTLMFYAENTGRRPSLEFILIAGVNDTPHEVEALVAFAHGMLCHVNLIPFNPLNDTSSSGTVYAPSSPERCAAIATRLQEANIECSLRRSRGADIAAACGQLKQLRTQQPT
jgi:23S rRNA (adenine2503-C2)-methyltransferase